MTPVYHRDEEEEEEEEGEEEQFRHPQREREGEGDIGFTLNKCIFGALVLLGLGTIFFSGKYLLRKCRPESVNHEYFLVELKGSLRQGCVILQVFSWIWMMVGCVCLCVCVLLSHSIHTMHACFFFFYSEMIFD